MEDLFGEEREPYTPKKITGKYQDYKIRYCYRESINEDKCKVCEFLIEKHLHGKVYYKCKQMGASGSSASDIRLKNVCINFKRPRS